MDVPLEQLIESALKETSGIRGYAAMVKSQHPLLDVMLLVNSANNIERVLMEMKKSLLPGKDISIAKPLKKNDKSKQ